MIKRSRTTFIVTTILVLVAIVVSYAARDDYVPSDETDDQATDQYVKSADDFQVTSDYASNNTWEYTIIGTLPNPCYSAKDSVIIAESYPEQVTLTLTITEPAIDQVCTQVIQDVNITGTYQASENASFDFKVQ